MAMGLRGLERKQEQAPSQLIRDTRTLGQRVAAFLGSSDGAAIIFITSAATCWFIPAIADILLLTSIGLFIYAFTRKPALPFRMPETSGMTDYNDPYPGSDTKFRKARGITFFGNELGTNEELWFNNDDMRTHVLIFGSTGSGKTEFLVSLAYNALVQGSGFIYVDGKGDNSLFSKIFSLCRSMGRSDDLLVLNFMTGARDIIGAQERRLSNTMNPFSMGSSSMLSQLVVSLMDSGSASPDGDMWKGRAISFVEALMKILVYARDADMILLDANTIRNYFVLDRIESIVVDKLLPRDNQEPVSLDQAPSNVLEPIRNFLFTLPGYNKDKKGKQVSQVLEQFGFVTMQLTRVFTSLADTYGHIIRTKLAEVDMKDVVLNRRILVVLLPALEKSPDELANLGKVVIASLRAMMAAGLGEDVEGEFHELIERKPTNAPSPYMCILDEYGYYAVPGFAVVPAQARSLGFSVVFAGQDLPAFQKASKEEALSIGANTNIKIAMKLEDPMDTWEFFNKTAGEAFVTKVDAFQTNPGSLTNTYMDTRSSSSERRARVDLLDLKEQREGYGHLFFKSNIVRFKVFFANPPPVKVMRLNQMLKVEQPPTQVIMDIDNRYVNFMEGLNEPSFNVAVATDSKEIAIISKALADNKSLGSIERGVSALLAYHEQTSAPPPPPVKIGEEKKEELNIFTQLRYNPEFKKDILADDFASFSKPLIEAESMQADLDKMGCLAGNTPQLSANVASEVVKDMRIATLYPPKVQAVHNAPQLAALVKGLNTAIKFAIKEGKNEKK